MRTAQACARPMKRCSVNSLTRRPGVAGPARLSNHECYYRVNSWVPTTQNTVLDLRGATYRSPTVSHTRPPERVTIDGPSAIIYREGSGGAPRPHCGEPTLDEHPLLLRPRVARGTDVRRQRERLREWRWWWLGAWSVAVVVAMVVVWWSARVAVAVAAAVAGAVVWVVCGGGSGSGGGGGTCVLQ